MESVFDNWTVTGTIREDVTGDLYKLANESGQEAMMKVISIPATREEYQEASRGRSQDQVIDYYKSIVEKMLEELVAVTKAPERSNIVKYQDCKVIAREDRFGWNIYVRMEKLTPYEDWIADKELTTRQIVNMGIELANALDHCKRLKVTHRGVCPSSLYVTRTGMLKLGGFGVPKDADRLVAGIEVAQPGPYLAPEILSGSIGDITADIYSVGVFLYALCNGNIMPGHPLEAPAYVPGAVVDIILKALSPNPRERYQSASGMKYDLMDCLKVIESDDLVYTSEHIAEAQARKEKEERGNTRGRLNVSMPARNREAKPKQTKQPVQKPARVKQDKPDSGVPKSSVADMIRQIPVKYAVIAVVAVVVVIALAVGARKSADNTGSPQETHDALSNRVQAETVTVPDLRNQGQLEAESALKEGRLKSGEITEEYSTDVAKGNVISQEPAAGESVNPNSAVNLVISKGEELFAVPQVKGKSESDAKAALKKASLKASVSTEYSSSVAKGKVISQSKKAGTKLSKGTTVKLVVSKGKKPAPKPTKKPAAPSTGGSSHTGGSTGGSGGGGISGWDTVN